MPRSSVALRIIELQISFFFQNWNFWSKVSCVQARTVPSSPQVRTVLSKLSQAIEFTKAFLCEEIIFIAGSFRKFR